MSAQASPANSVANCTVNNVENDTLIAKVQLLGKNDLLYKKVRVSTDNYIKIWFFPEMKNRCFLSCWHRDSSRKKEDNHIPGCMKEKDIIEIFFRLETMNEHLVY